MAATCPLSALAHKCSLCPRSFHLMAVRDEAVVISGRKLAQQINQEARQVVEEWVASGNKWPHLSVMRVFETPASHSYVHNKVRAAVGINSDANVTISHQYTPKEQLKKHTILTDVVISAAGIPNLITEGAASSRSVNTNPKLVGDVDFEEVRQKGGYITPVPGGVVAMLMKNTMIAAKKVLRLEEQEALKPKELGVASNELLGLLCHEQHSKPAPETKQPNGNAIFLISPTEMV
uniref:Tetrahydrofolate dehydrogenase/cyclohydrolase NAD(P)-binding domain-containing protein n=1 Tax=Saimiri boliviensis boliviensis TaxID=39432 RepID=A0A2K6V168_SAIBB